MKTIPFNPVDYIFTGTGSQPITFAFYYNNKLDAAQLSTSLQETLNHFPILSSKLLQTSDSEYQFQIMEKELSIEIINSEIDFKESDNIQKYIKPVESIPGNNLARINLTQTPNGSVLAASISHALVDGSSFFHFLSSWARLTRGDRILPPGQNRTLIRQKQEDNHLSNITPDDILNNCGLFWGEKRADIDELKVKEHKEFISKDSIHTHLEEFKNNHQYVSLTENDIITSFLWKKYLPQWHSGNIPQTFMTCPVDVRRTLKTLSRNQLGCILSFATAKTDIDDLNNTSVSELAVKIKTAVRNIDREYAIKSMQTLNKLREEKGPSVFENIHLCHPQNGMIVTNLTRMPLNDINFGNGSPDVYLTFTDVSGGAAIMASDDGVKVLISVPENQKKVK